MMAMFVQRLPRQDLPPQMSSRCCQRSRSLQEWDRRAMRASCETPVVGLKVIFPFSDRGGLSCHLLPF